MHDGSEPSFRRYPYGYDPPPVAPTAPEQDPIPNPVEELAPDDLPPRVRTAWPSRRPRVSHEQLVRPALIAGFALCCAVGVWSARVPTSADVEPIRPAAARSAPATAGHAVVIPRTTPTPSSAPAAAVPETSPSPSRRPPAPRRPAVAPVEQVQPARARAVRPRVVHVEERVATPPRTPHQVAVPPKTRVRPAQDREAAAPKVSRPGPAWLYADDPCAHFQQFQRPTCRAMLGLDR
jgi:hypothetical protein